MTSHEPADLAPRTVALRLAYDGRRFDAYARDPTADTVEGNLIAALRGQGYVEESFKSGSRTDAGVSALENVCRATIVRSTLRGLVPAVQRDLPEGMWLTAAAEVPEGWNPRHAHTRIYRYCAVQAGEDEGRMRQACERFVGRHDMTAFARLEEGRRPERDVRAFTLEQGVGAGGNPTWVFRTVSDGYLWNQVRRMVGAVLAVGAGEAGPDDVSESLRSKVPHKRFGLASPGGLLLESVQYRSLVWDEAAGRLGAHRVPRVLQEADVEARLASHLSGLAPWPYDASHAFR